MEKYSRVIKIELLHIPKISTNKMYQSQHWTKRKANKDNIKRLVDLQTNFRGVKPCKVFYDFEFSKRPLDCSNTSYLAKMVEDVIFPDDSPKIVTQVTLRSRKSLNDKLTIYIKEL